MTYTSMTQTSELAHSTLAQLGVTAALDVQGGMSVRSPIDGGILAHLRPHSSEELSKAIARAHDAWQVWRTVPAPARGELVRLLGQELRAQKQALGQLISLEAGKITSEGLGEVQEMIDICDFAVGLSRQLYGLTIASERPGHRMLETWHPLGVVGVITAFNFPMAVWAWNTALALVCGDAVIWKPPKKHPCPPWRARLSLSGQWRGMRPGRRT
ncbi:succinate-semialdehyde dehydrogenase i, nADP-dependent [Alcaligenes sp. HPC1271]|nr:succinate-semialdehyde dehydrogenase i, nADP-dependent [Alcaligenes sp. HPC1271]